MEMSVSVCRTTLSTLVRFLGTGFKIHSFGVGSLRAMTLCGRRDTSRRNGQVVRVLSNLGGVWRSRIHLCPLHEVERTTTTQQSP